MWILAYTELALVLALCGWLYTIAPVIGVWMLAGIIGCFAYSLAATSRKRRIRQ